MADERPVQHTPKHLEKDADVFDTRHPAASAFAPAQPAAGVVADDVEDKGQNLRGGPTASAASGEYSDQKEVLAQQHQDSLRASVTTPVAGEVKDGQATAVKDDSAKDDGTKAADTKATDTKTARPSKS